MTGYRIGFAGIKGGLRTLFIWNNESVNVWTHFVGKLVVWMIIGYVAFSYQNKFGDQYANMILSKNVD